MGGTSPVERNYSRLIGLIYDAARTPGLWPDLLEATGAFLDAAGPEGVREAAPHFDRAEEIGRKLRETEDGGGAGNEMLNRLPLGLIVADRNACILALNDRAAALLRGALLQRDMDGKLRTASARETDHLRRLIRQCADSPATRGTPLGVGAAASGYASLWLSPTRHPDAPGGAAMICIASTQIRPEYGAELMREFGLTAAEERLVRLLANGCDNLTEAARELGLSTHTVRAQIKQVFEKTGVNSQMALVKKVLTSPAALFGVARPPLSLREESPCHTMRLRDGRALAWEEYGDPQGRPVFYFHAFLGSRLQYPVGETAAARLGLRIIAPDRPGCGRSDPQPGRRLADWASDVEQLADHLELPRFSVLGRAAGATYALACGHRLPGRVNRLALVSGGAPVSGSLRLDQLYLDLARRAPSLFRRFMRIMCADVMRNPERALEKRWRLLAPEDRKLIERDNATREMYLASILEGLRQGGDHACDDLLAMIDATITPAEVRVPVRLWHGENDRQFPPSAARRLAEALPDCQATCVPSAGATLMIHRWDDILSDLATA